MIDAVAGLVLAGGRSRRMGGGEKFLLELGGRTLIGHAIERLKPQVGEIAISANCDPALLSDYPYAVLPDAPPAGRGPLAGIIAGLDWAAAHTQASHLATAAADTPFFPTDLVEQLAAAAKGEPETIVLAASGGRTHPVFGLWPVPVRDALRHWLTAGASLKVTDFTDRQRRSLCNFAINGGVDPFFNINTPNDLAEAARRTVEKAS